MSSVFLKLCGAALNVLYEKELCISKAHVRADGIAETNISHIFRHTPGISSAQPSGGRQPQYAGNAWVCVCGPSALRPCIASEPATHAPARRQIWRGQSQWDKGTILIPHTITFTDRKTLKQICLLQSWTFYSCCFSAHDGLTWGGSDCTAVR